MAHETGARHRQQRTDRLGGRRASSIIAAGRSTASTTTCARDFFGPDGDTTLEPASACAAPRTRFTHHELDIRDRAAMLDARRTSSGPTSSSTAPPSRRTTCAKDRPFDDFDVNAVGTLNLLEAARRALPRGAVRLHEHEQGLRRRAQRAAAGRARRRAGTTPTRPTSHGIAETCRIDRCLHSLFGASKVAADVMVQEYGRYFGMPTGLLPRRLPHRARTTRGVELHGFLALPGRSASARGGTYRIYGYKGKQVRDNIHSLRRVRRVPRGLLRAPRVGGGLQPRRRPRQQRVDPRGGRPLRGADRQDARRASTSTRTASATTSATSATCGACRPTIPAGS